MTAIRSRIPQQAFYSGHSFTVKDLGGGLFGPRHRYRVCDESGSEWYESSDRGDAIEEARYLNRAAKMTQERGQ